MTTSPAERAAARAAGLPTRPLLLAVALLSGLVALVWLSGWDEPLIRAAQTLQDRPSRHTWLLVTSLGEGAVLSALLLPLALGRRDLLSAVLPVALTAFVLTHALKQGLSLPRPVAVLDDLQIIGPLLKRRAFPSGHAACVTGACALLATRLGRRWAPALVAFAALVCCSRVVVAAHWPRDALAGAATGLFGAWLGLGWQRRWAWVEGLAGRRTTAALLALAGVSVLLDGPASDERHAAAWWLVLVALLLSTLQVARGCPALAATGPGRGPASTD